MTTSHPLPASGGARKPPNPPPPPLESAAAESAPKSAADIRPGPPPKPPLARVSSTSRCREPVREQGEQERARCGEQSQSSCVAGDPYQQSRAGVRLKAEPSCASENPARAPTETDEKRANRISGKGVEPRARPAGLPIVVRGAAAGSPSMSFIIGRGRRRCRHSNYPWRKAGRDGLRNDAVCTMASVRTPSRP